MNSTAFLPTTARPRCARSSIAVTRGARVCCAVSVTTKCRNCFRRFAPKAIGMVGRKLPPPTLSRCIFVELRRRRQDETIEKFKHVDDAELADLRRRLRRWSIDNEDILRNANAFDAGRTV